MGNGYLSRLQGLFENFLKKSSRQSSGSGEPDFDVLPVRIKDLSALHIRHLANISKQKVEKRALSAIEFELLQQTNEIKNEKKTGGMYKGIFIGQEKC